MVSSSVRLFFSQVEIAVMDARVLIFLWVVVVLCGCTPKPEVDRSLLSGDPCAPPCWQNITPGMANEEDVRSVLEDNPYVKQDSVTVTRTERAGVPLLIFGWQGRGKMLNRVYLHKGKVFHIKMTLDYLLTLGKVVKEFGRPETVYAHLDGNGGYSVVFEYPTQGLTFYSYTWPEDDIDIVVEGEMGLVSEGLLVTWVSYYAPTSLERALRDVFLFEQEKVESFMAHPQDWEGFGMVALTKYEHW